MNFRQVNSEQPIEQGGYWTGNTSNALDQPQQDPLMTGENSGAPAETMSPSFRDSLLHSFLHDAQSTQPNIPPENSEYMSLERLGQGAK